MGRSMSTTGPTLSSAPWAAEAISPAHLMPGGAKLDAAAFTEEGATTAPVPSGTAVGRTLAERDAGDALGPADDADDEIYLTAFDVQDAIDNNDVELMKPHAGVVVRESFLPGFSGLDSGVKTAVRAAYNCIRGAA